MEKVLLVDDEIEILTDRSNLIRELGYKCLTASNGAEALSIVKTENPDIILTDMKMPNYDGFYLLNSTKEIDPYIPVIFITAYGTVESAVHAMKLGAHDYIQKPISPELLEIALKKAIEYRKLKSENLRLKTQVKESYQLKYVVSESHEMVNVVKRVLKVAKTDVNVLIYGETGTGKEMIARNIHLLSPRKNKPFIPVDCVALPDTLIESEIFGFEKGAFTGAAKSKPGVLELANGGSLFLDEIVELKLDLQAKLLRVIQERQFRRLGGTKMIKVDIRIISATNQNPEEAITQKKLRDDLYFRLNVVPIYLPPLRERKEDIPELVRQFIRELNPSLPYEIKGITNEAMVCLKNYHWPGNVRELKNVIEQAMSLTEEERLGINDLPESLRKNYKLLDQDSYEGLVFKEAKNTSLNKFYRKYFGNLLQKHNGNLSKVAEISHISRKTLYRILAKIGMLKNC